MPTAHPPPDRPGSDAGQDKKALRRRIRATRREHAAGADRAAEGASIAQAVLELLERSTPPPEVAGGSRRIRRESPATSREGRAGARRCVAAYESLPTEPPTEALIAALQEHGYRVIVPVLLDDLDLDWRDATGPDALRTVGGGGGDPAGRTLGRGAIAEARLVITPALSIDRDGVRLGQGGGSYDRALARRSPGVLVVAVVHDDELVDGPLPHEPHDERVDAVVTPTRGLIHLPPSR